MHGEPGAHYQASLGPIRGIGKTERRYQGGLDGFGRDVGRAQALPGQDVQIVMGRFAAALSNARLDLAGLIKQDRRCTIYEGIRDLKIAWKDIELKEIIPRGGYAKVNQGH